MFWKEGVFTKLSAKTLRTSLKDFNHFLENINKKNNIQELNIEYKYGLPALEFNQFRKQFKNLKKINFPKLIPAAIRDLDSFKAIDPPRFALTELIAKERNMLLLQAEGIENDSPTGEEYARYIAVGIELNFEIQSRA